MRFLHLITQLLFVSGAAAAAALHELFLVVDYERDIAISVSTGSCYATQKTSGNVVYDCQKLGASRVFGFRNKEQGLPVMDALDLFRTDACPLHHRDIQTLILGDSCSKLEQSKWVQHGVSIQTSWLTAGILQGPDLVHARLADLCPEQETLLRSQDRALQQKQQSNSTQQATSIVAWDADDPGSDAWLSHVSVVPMPTELSKAGTVMAITAGAFHTVALLTDGSVVSWGLDDSNYFPLLVPDEVQKTSAQAISAGSFHTLALLKGSGKVVCWGRNDNDLQQCSMPPFRGVLAVKALNFSSFARLEDNTWFAWGQQMIDWQQSGFGHRRDIVDITFDTYYYTGLLVLLSNHSLLHYGGSISPPPYLTGSNVTAVCSGVAFAVAVLSNGTVIGWGHPTFSNSWYSIPTSIQGHTSKVACGRTYVVAQLYNNSIVAWGTYAAGQKPIGILPSDITAFSAGALHSVYLLADGSVREEGSYPPQITQLADIISVAQSKVDSVVVAVREDGCVVAWGDMSQSDWWYTLPAPLYGETLPVAAVAVSDSFAVALLKSGHVSMWGDINATVPLELESGGVSAVAAGGSFAMALKAGRVYAWGRQEVTNDYCNLTSNIPDTALVNVTQISAGYDHALALLSNGQVVAWGCNDENQTDVPMNIRGALSIAAGHQFSVALLKSGSVTPWGDFHGPPYNVSSALLPTQPSSMDISADESIMVLLGDKTVTAWSRIFKVWYQPMNVQHNAIGISAGDANIVLVARSSAMQPPLPPSPPVPPSTTGDMAGTVVGWGTSIYQHNALPPSNVTSANSVTAIAAGDSHALALHKDGSITAWGDNSYNQTNIPDVVRQGPVKAIAAGGLDSIVLMENDHAGNVLWWGANDWDQDLVPDVVQAGGVQAVIATDATFFAKLSNGSWVGWGDWTGVILDLNVMDISLSFVDGGCMLLANGSIAEFSTASLFPALTASNFTALCSKIYTGTNSLESFGMALDAAGNLWTWGSSSSTSTAWYTVPNDVQGQAKAIACGSLHALAQLNDGSIVTWGAQIPQGTPPPNAKAMAAGSGFSLFLLADGNVLQSGGLPGKIDNATVPAGLFKVIAVSARGNTTIALNQDGSVVAWGGVFTQVQQLPDELVNNGAIAVAAGTQHALAVLPSGVVVQWGSISAAVPQQARSGGVKAVAAGGGFSLALTKDGKVIVWASNDACSSITQLPSAAQSNVIAISAKDNHGIALLSNGLVVEWGCGWNTVPANATGVVAIAGGKYYTLGILRSGAVVAWGDDPRLTNVPTAAMANVTAIAAGGTHAVALLSNGSVVTWGDNSTGQLLVPDEYQGRIVAVAAHDYGTVAIVQPAQTSLSPPSPVMASIPEPPVPPLPPVPAPIPSLIGEGSGNSSSLSVRKIVGIACGATAALLLGAALVYMRRKQSKNSMEFKPAGQLDHCQPFADITGLTPGEVFTRATAHDYTWCEGTGTDCMPLPLSANDTEVYKPIQLSKKEVQEQLVLVKNGLLGRGATALVFKCIWPSRFGPNNILAAKVLKDGYESDIPTLQSFYYEATVLASLHPPHRNVIRIFGYCFEAPTVCLILELLPGSLKSLLYKHPSTPAATTGSRMYVKQPASTAHTTAYVTSLGTSTDSAPDDACTTYITITDSVGLPEVAGSSSNSRIQKPMPSDGAPNLSMLCVLQISIDIAAGLKYLHDMPLVVDVAQHSDVPPEGDCEPLETVQESEAATSSHVQTNPSLIATTQKTSKVVHRDLKPANILIAADGTAKISDFGLARQQMNTTIVTEHLAAGTLPYMAPELLVAVRVGTAAMPATKRVDIYSMAMIMWEMLSGRVPWSHMSEPGLLAAVMSGRRPELPMEQAGPITQPLSEVPASLNALPEFNAIIRACWNQREHRRPDAAALHSMLNALLDKYQH